MEILELETAIIKMKKKILTGRVNRKNGQDIRISELENKTIKVSQFEQQREKRDKKCTEPSEYVGL